MRRLAVLALALLSACSPPTQTRQITLEEELAFYTSDKSDEARTRLGWNLEQAAVTPYGDVWLFVSERTAMSDKWMIWQEVHVERSIKSGLRFIYRDQVSGDWFLYDFLRGTTQGPTELRAETAELIFAKITAADELDASKFDIYPKAWYLTVYDGAKLVRKAVMADALEAGPWRPEDDVPVYDGAYKSIADLIYEVRGIAPWPPGPPDEQNNSLNHAFRVWLRDHKIARPAAAEGAHTYFEGAKDYFAIRKMDESAFLDLMRMQGNVVEEGGP